MALPTQNLHHGTVRKNAFSIGHPRRGEYYPGTISLHPYVAYRLFQILQSENILPNSYLAKLVLTPLFQALQVVRTCRLGSARRIGIRTTRDLRIWFVAAECANS